MRQYINLSNASLKLVSPLLSEVVERRNLFLALNESGLCKNKHPSTGLIRVYQYSGSAKCTASGMQCSWSRRHNPEHHNPIMNTLHVTYTHAVFTTPVEGT